MGKVTFRLPSEAVKYGYVEYTFEGDYLDDGGYTLGVEYKQFVDNFQRGEASKPATVRAVTNIQRIITEEEVYAALAPTQDEAVSLIQETLGASVYDEEVEVATPEWEDPPAAPSDDDWDFG